MLHICPRKDCIHNSSTGCTFYLGDLYFGICLDNESMYTPKEKPKKEEESVNISTRDICYL